MGKRFLGVELGSTRIKSVVSDETGKVFSVGVSEWENKLTNGLWSYGEKEIWQGLNNSIQNALDSCIKNSEFNALGISAMMHGYIVLDKDDNFLVPFRTWRNTNTGDAATKLSELFGFNIPMRWSIAHLYQSILNEESHVKNIAYITTLSGYVHYKLTGRKVLGIGDASGMFPIDVETNAYNAEMLDKFDELIKSKNLGWKIRDILPEVLKAGDNAGRLTEYGAEKLVKKIKCGTKLCPPEGDAGTGMVATHSVKAETGNVSAGTSVFAMVVLKEPLKFYHKDIDVVCTPDGKPVAMVHACNCTSDINAWVNLFYEIAEKTGANINKSDFFATLFEESKNSDANCSGLVNYNYISGEHITDVKSGTPLFFRNPESSLTLANFMKCQIYSALSTLSIGMEILTEQGVKIKLIYGHGGFFKTPIVGQTAMSAALKVPVAVTQNVGEGGAWGMAVLAAFTEEKTTLENYLDKIGSNETVSVLTATDKEIEDFEKFLTNYKKNLIVEKTSSHIF